MDECFHYQLNYRCQQCFDAESAPVCRHAETGWRYPRRRQCIEYVTWPWPWQVQETTTDAVVDALVQVSDFSVDCVFSCRYVLDESSSCNYVHLVV